MRTVSTKYQYPKLHNAMWPGLVGKGSPGAEPCIDLDTMLDLTANAEVDGIKFDGVDLFLFDPHISIDIDDDGLKRVADKIQSKGFVVGSVVAPVRSANDLWTRSVRPAASRENCANWAFALTASCALIRPAA